MGKVENKIVYVVDSAKSAQFRYRCKNIAEILIGTEWNIKWVLKSEFDKARREVDKADLVVVGRQTDKDGRVGKLIDLAHKNGTKVLFDLDDLVFDYRDLLGLMVATNSKNAVYWIGYFWGIRRIAKKVDGFIVTNEFLGQKIRRSFGKPYRVIRNSLNREQLEVSKKYVNSKDVHEGFVVGYFSGSPTHAKDFRLIESELIRFLNIHNDARLLVVGYMEFSGRMRELLDYEKVEFAKPVDYLRLQKLMADVDVNIAPLVINDFTNCKSELKFFEAAAVETTTIASPTYVFEKAIMDGKNGFLAQPNEWYEKLEYLYKNREKNREIAKQARKDAVENYAGEKLRREAKEAYEYFAK